MHSDTPSLCDGLSWDWDAGMATAQVQESTRILHMVPAWLWFRTSLFTHILQGYFTDTGAIAPVAVKQPWTLRVKWIIWDR